MSPLPRIWIVSALALLTLAACSNSTPPSGENTSPATATSPGITANPSDTEASPETQDDSSAMADSKTTFANMQEIVSKTTSAVNAGNFDQARQEFKTFDQDYWPKVEDGVKAKSANTYKQIENDMDNVTNGLRVVKPDKTKVLASLQSLSKTLDSYTSKY